MELYTINNPTTTLVKEMAGNTVFGVEFTKKDGSTRRMSCKIGVMKNLKGGSNRQEAHKHLLGVYEMAGKTSHYKTVNLDTTTKITVRGKVYGVSHVG